MIWDNWIPNRFLTKSEICGVEVCYKDSQIIYYYTHLRKNKGKLELISTGTCGDLSELPKILLKSRIPIALTLNGQGIILKKINLNGETGQKFEEIIQQHLPALNVSDFYIQLYRQQETSVFIAFCRKDLVDLLLKEFRDQKFILADVFLGAPSIIGMEPLWVNHNVLKTSLQRVELTNGQLDLISADENAANDLVKVDNITFDRYYTLGFSAGLSYLLNRPIAESNKVELSDIRMRHQENNKINFLTAVLVGLALILSLTNVLFYTSFFDAHSKLETELGVYQGKYEEINGLLSGYEKNKSLIENAGLLNKNRLSEYADRIGKTLPEEVVLSELYFNPIMDNDVEVDSLVKFQNKTLTLKGICSKSFVVNEWINVLKMQKFIKDVTLESFLYRNEGFLPNFELKLKTE